MDYYSIHILHGVSHQIYSPTCWVHKPRYNNIKVLLYSMVIELLSPTKQMFSGVYWNHPVCWSIHVSVCVQNTKFCQSASGGIKSDLVTVLVVICFIAI